MQALKKVVEKIKQNKSFLVTSHVNLEGDALGSELAFYELLAYLGKKAIVVNEDELPNEYKFMPGLKKIKKIGQVKNKSFDVFVALDCSDLDRCKDVAKLSQRAKIKINIDHHISNNRFADINWVNPNASSASEMVYELYRQMHIPLDKNKALYLYVGILTDTGSFHYPNTTSRSMRIASELIHYNLAINKIYRSIYANISFSEAELLAKVINTMKSEMDGKIVWFTIRRDLLKGKKISVDLTEHVLNFGRLVNEADAVVLFKENLKDTSQIRVNFRSKTIDVNRVAQSFGGGGHKNASGATIKGSLPAVKQKVIKKIKEQLLNARR